MADDVQGGVRGVTCEHLEAPDAVGNMHGTCCGAFQKFAESNHNTTCPVCIALGFAGAVGNTIACSTLDTEQKFALLQSAITFMFAGFNVMSSDEVYQLQSVAVDTHKVVKS